jgi:predicted nucleic acid-binding protein
MKVLIDSTVWSLAFRRSSPSFNPSETAAVQAAYELVDAERACLLGMVRQEVLSGFSTQKSFDKLCDSLSFIEDLPVIPADHVTAAKFFNQCRAKGIQGGSVDFLICAVAHRLDYPILSTDNDFLHYASVLPIRLHPVMQASIPIP